MISTIETYGPDSTWKVGFKMGSEASPGQVIALTGEIGAGKTVFAKGFAAGLGIEDTVISPTFTILQIYKGGRLKLYHFDVFRIGDVGEMTEIGWDDFICGNGVCLIEWADLIPELIDELSDDKVWKVTIENDPGNGPDFRRIKIDRPPREGIESHAHKFQ